MGSHVSCFGRKTGTEFTNMEEQKSRILLIGKTGTGKSSTANTILGAQVFPVSTGVASATKQAQLQEDVTRTRKVVDTPDLSEMDQEAVKNEVKRWKELTSPQPSAILLVVRADRPFTPAEYAAYRQTMDLVGKQMQDKLIVVITWADFLGHDRETRLRKFEEDLQRAEGNLQHVIRQEAGGRFVLFDNTATDIGRIHQVQELFDVMAAVAR